MLTDYQNKLLERYRKGILYTIPRLTYETVDGVDKYFLTTEAKQGNVLERWLQLNKEINDEYVRCGDNLDFEFSNAIDEMLKNIYKK